MDSTRRQDGYALAMLAVEAALFAYLSQTFVLPAATVILALFGAATQVRLKVLAERRFLSALALLLVLLASWLIAPYEPPAGIRVFLQYPLAHVLGLYFLALQALQFLIRSPGERLTSLIPLFGTFVLICAGDIYVNAVQMLAYQAAAIVFVILSAGFYGAMRSFPDPSQASGRLVGEFAGLAVSAAVTWSGCLILHRHWDDLERFFEPKRPEALYSGIGFSRQARLGTVHHRKTQQENATALRVYSPAMPGYLRGAVFDDYSDAQWGTGADVRVLSPVRESPPLVPERLAGTPVFNLRDTPSTAWTSLEVWKDPQVPADAVFTPLGASVLEAGIDSLSLDEYDVCASGDLAPGQEFVVHVPQPRQVPSLLPATAKRLTHLAPAFRNEPRLQVLAAKVFEGCQTEQQKIAAVERWFHGHYRYSLNVTPPPGPDPLVWFLLERPAAHCEYFASGALALLRLSGVPCRYVTGFVAAEYNPAGAYWIARNKDAHAWVEAWLPESGWVTVEATPSQGVPAASSGLAASHVLDDLGLRIQRIRSSVARSGWRGLLDALWGLILLVVTTAPGLALLSGIALWVLWPALRRMRWRRGPSTTGREGELTRLLAEMDRRVRRLAFRRQPSETLHQFAARLRAAEPSSPRLNTAAEWYLAYAAARYGDQGQTSDVKRLREMLMGGQSTRSRRLLGA